MRKRELKIKTIFYDAECFPSDVIFDERNDNIVVSNYCRSNKFSLDKNYRVTKWSFNQKHAEYSQENNLCIQPGTNNFVATDVINDRLQILSNYTDSISNLYNINLSGLKLQLDQHNVRYNDVRCNMKGNIFTRGMSCDEFLLLLHDEKGRFIKSFDSKLLNPHSIHFNQHNNQMLINNWKDSTVEIWNSDCSQHINTIIMDDLPYCVSADNYGNMLTGHDHEVCIYDLRMNKMTDTIEHCDSKGEQFKIVSGLCVDNKNNIIVAARHNNSVFSINHN